MSAEVRELVDRRWEEYGIPAIPAAEWCESGDPARVAAAVTSLTHASRLGIESVEGSADLSSHDNETPHLPPPSLWPIGFAIGVACLLVGLVVSTLVASSAP